MRSIKLSPGFWVISTTIRCDNTRVPPVTELRSPPLSRITGALSPVNRALIDASDAIDDVTVARNHVSGLADHPIARPEVRRRDRLLGPVEHGGIDEPTSDGVGLGAAQRVGLRLPATLGDSFREVGE
jgi:hypothetical protein